VVYFSTLQRLGWVDPSGKEEKSACQGNYPPGPPRKYFRLTRAGREAGDAAWSNPQVTLIAEVIKLTLEERYARLLDLIEPTDRQAAIYDFLQPRHYYRLTARGEAEEEAWKGPIAAVHPEVL